MLYGWQLGHEASGGVFYRDVWIADGYPGGFTEAVLNDVGKAFIQAGDYSAFCLRTRVDIQNNSPPMGAGELDRMLYVDAVDGAEYYAELVFSG